MADKLRRYTQPADHCQHARTSRRERFESETSPPLNPVMTWSIVLFASAALWGGLGLAVSSLVSALL